MDNEALSAIENVWFGSDPLEKRFGEGITRKDLLTLRGLEWLNDEVINTYLGLVCERARQDTTLPKVSFVFSIFCNPVCVPVKQSAVFARVAVATLLIARYLYWHQRS